MTLSETIPDPQFCIICKKEAETTEDDGGQIWLDNLIRIPLDNFLEKYPSIKELCENPMDYAIDLCEECEQQFMEGDLEITLEEIMLYAYRFV